MPAYDYPRPAFTADAVVLRGSARAREVLLIRRGKEPFLGMWALPGGFVDEMEAPLLAAKRELAEEAGLVLDGDYYQVGVFGEPGRDPRGWIVSCAFVTLLAEDARGSEPTAGDDATEAAWHPVSDLPPLAADHARIISETLRRVECDLVPWRYVEGRDL